MQWIDGPDKTGSNGVGNDDLGVKPDEGESVGRRCALQLGVQELELEQQLALQERRKEIQEAPPDPEEETREVRLNPEEGTQQTPSDPAEEAREAPSDRENKTQRTPSDPEEETPEAPSDPEEETLEAPSNVEEETKYVAGLTGGPTDLKGPVVPARRKLTISGNLPPNNVKSHVESAGARRRRRTSIVKFSADERGRRQRECVNVRRRGHDDFSEEGGATGADSEGHVTGAVNRQQVINALEMEE